MNKKHDSNDNLTLNKNVPNLQMLNLCKHYFYIKSCNINFSNNFFINPANSSHSQKFVP